MEPRLVKDGRVGDLLYGGVVDYHHLPQGFALYIVASAPASSIAVTNISDGGPTRRPATRVLDALWQEEDSESVEMTGAMLLNGEKVQKTGRQGRFTGWDQYSM
eukprot:4718719-Amphidinium_carterae.1